MVAAGSLSCSAELSSIFSSSVYIIPKQELRGGVGSQHAGENERQAYKLSKWDSGMVGLKG